MKKIPFLSTWLTAHDSAQVLSLKYGRPISSKYIRSLSKRAKNPVRTQQVGNRLLYNHDDILASNIKEKQLNKKQDI